MERKLSPPEAESRLFQSLHSTHPVTGFTHNFYRYPARMSPEFAREAIAQFSEPGDTILDPFLGGGTTIVEAVACGRRSIGVDLNPLAVFVSEVKTTPLSIRDIEIMTHWASRAPFYGGLSLEQLQASSDPRTKNLPSKLVEQFEALLGYVQELRYPRQRRFARCALLRLGQWAVDCKSEAPRLLRMHEKLEETILGMLTGLDQLVQSAAGWGLEKRSITGYRSMLQRSSVGIEEALDPAAIERPRLVLTSPPYPGVHVLYHRWQVQGRRETPAPYWLIGSPDGKGATYFTMGSRTQFGVDNYFRTLTAVFRSVRSIIHDDGLVVQLVSFSDAEHQLPAFLEAMDAARFQEAMPALASPAESWRTIPNRKWYCRIDATRASARELLLIHRPI